MAKSGRASEGESPDRVTTTVSLDRETYKALRHLAVDENTTVRDLIRDAVADYLKKKGSRR